VTPSLVRCDRCSCRNIWRTDALIELNSPSIYFYTTRLNSFPWNQRTMKLKPLRMTSRVLDNSLEGEENHGGGGLGRGMRKFQR
jgi:hypothetical protein